MTIPRKSSLFSRAASYRAAAGLALALAAFAGGAAPVAAACSGPNLTVNRANAVDYVCQVRCGADKGGAARLLVTRDRPGHDATPCMDLCDAWVGCRAISFEFLTETGSDGRVYQTTVCYIWGEGEIAISDRAGEPSPRARQPGVCYRRWAPSRDRRLQIDVDRLQQDQMRPGIPGPTVPKKP